ncbi:hypothetical protein STHU_21380 [Allostella humosa]|nr:hypothetical protein STHU_21380 [Stella humosa]
MPTPPPAYDVAAPADLLALVERLARDYITGPGIRPGEITANHPAVAAIGAELDRVMPHQSVELDFAYHHFFRGIWHIGLEREQGEDAQHVAVNFVDSYFENRAMTEPAVSAAECAMRIHHAKRMVLDGTFYGDASDVIGFLDTVEADFGRILREAGR